MFLLLMSLVSRKATHAILVLWRRDLTAKTRCSALLTVSGHFAAAIVQGVISAHAPVCVSPFVTQEPGADAYFRQRDDASSFICKVALVAIS